MMNNTAMNHQTLPRICLLGLLLTIGCSKENSLGRIPVQGNVTLDGSPLDYGSITFNPKSGATVSGGAVIVNGHYAIPERQGLPPGEYQVSIYSPKTVAPENPNEPSPPGVERISSKFNTKTELSVRVNQDKEAQFDFHTTSSAGKK